MPRRTVDSPDYLELIDDRDGLLVVNKPAGLVCHPTRGDDLSSLIGRVRMFLRERRHESPIHMINRLDRETSGIVLVAICDDLARRIRGLWDRHQVAKTYLALCHGHLEQDEETLRLPLGEAEDSKVWIRSRVREDGTPAETRYRVLERFEHGSRPFSLVEVFPKTGRKHQIRVHLSHLGHPVVGDKIYGPDERFYLALVDGSLGEADLEELLLPNQALHASRLSFELNGIGHDYRAEPGSDFAAFLEEAGVSLPES